MLDYHGLLDHRAGPLVQTASRHRVTSSTVTNNVDAVRAAGHRQPLPAPLIADATRTSTPDDDHLSRARIAATLGLPTPAAAPITTPAPARAAPAAHLTVASAAVRLLGVLVRNVSPDPNARWVSRWVCSVSVGCACRV